MRLKIYFAIAIYFCVLVGGQRAVSAQGGAPQNVTWTNLVHVTATGNSIQKTSGCDGCADAGATSQQSITSGDGYFEFTVSAVAGQRFAGLSNGDGGTHWNEIDFAFRLWGASGDLDVQENGTYRYLGTTYAVGDVLRVAVEASAVKYYKNGTLLYTSTMAPTYPLQVDTSLVDAGTTVGNAIITAASAAPPDAAPSRLIGQSVTASKVTLYWLDNSTNESGFKVERAPEVAPNTPGTFTQVGTAAAGATALDDTSTAGNTTYYFRARATNAAGDSAYSNAFRVETPAAGRTLTTVKVFRHNTRVRVGEQVTFVCTAYDQNGVEIKYVVPQWSVSDGAVAQLLPDAEKPMRDTWAYRYMYVKALAAGSSNVTATVAGVSGTAANMTAYGVTGTPAVSVGGDNAGGAITKKVGEVVFLDLSASQNLYEYVINWGDGDSTTGVGEHVVHAYLVPGVYPVTVTVKNKAGAAAALTSPINVTVNPHTQHTTAGVDVFTATNAADLLARYNAMPLSGGVIKIPKGTVIEGTVLLPERPFTNYVTIMSDGVMPDIRNRISNTSAEIATVKAMGTNDIPITVGKRAHHIRFVGIKVTIREGFNTYYGFHIGDHDGTQDTVAEQAHDIILQHCVVDSADNSSMTHGVLVDGKRVSVISSWIGNVKLTSQIGGDSTGINTYTGEGLHAYHNNFIESAGEGYITAGTSNAMKVTLSGVEFRRNYFTKRASWTTSQYAMKNHFEIKMGRNIYVESCVMHYQKNNDQFYAIVLKSSNQVGDSPGNAAEFVRIENCLVTEGQGGFNEAWDRYDNHLSIKPRHFSLRNVLFHKIDAAVYGARGRAVAVGNSDYTDLEHVTALPSAEAVAFDAGNAQHLRIRNSIIGAGDFGIFKGEDDNSGSGQGTNAFVRGTYDQWEYAHNVTPLYGFEPRDPDKYPNTPPNDSNSYPVVASRAAAASHIGFVDYANGNYRLTPTSPYKGAASDGSDLGADQELIEQRTAHVQTGQWAQQTSCATPPAGLVISEFRLRGAAGGADEYVELYNNSDSPITVCTADGSGGWTLAARSADGSTASPVFTLPVGTTVPARAHYLAVNATPNVGYSLGSHPAGNGTTAGGNITFLADLADDSGLALFNTSNTANFAAATRLDAVGFSGAQGAVADLYREGAGLSPAGTAAGQYAFVRKLCDFVAGVGCTTPGTPKDTGDNPADFLLVDTNGLTYGAVQAKLGAPGPENLSSPVQRTTIGMALLDPSVANTQPPNRVRDFTSDPANNATFGTLSLRRRVTNNTGANVTRLRFRVIDLTTFPSPAGVADLRPISSGAIQVTVQGTLLTVQGTSVEQPPAQPNGGGFNTALAVGVVSLAQPLAPGASVDVQFLLGVQQAGTFHFIINIEALP